ncbi:hypothetical protein [Paraburkholderia tropica]
MCDDEKTSLAGFSDPGTLTFDFFIDPTDADYHALLAARCRQGQGSPLVRDHLPQQGGAHAARGRAVDQRERRRRSGGAGLGHAQDCRRADSHAAARRGHAELRADPDRHTVHRRRAARSAAHAQRSRRHGLEVRDRLERRLGAERNQLEAGQPHL